MLVLLTTLLGRLAVDYTCPALPPISVPESAPRPIVEGNFRFVNGKQLDHSGPTTTVTSPIHCGDARCVLGSLPDMTSAEAIEAVDAAAAAWDQGQGAWPQLPLSGRIAAIERLVAEVVKVRDEMVQLLMWEIGKTASDAAKEVDRTLEFITAVIAQLRRDPSVGVELPGHAPPTTGWCDVSGVGVRVRRGPVGVLLGLAPFNYPLNEMWSMLIPALLMGNTAVLKLPAIGGLVHLLAARAFETCLPAGVINFVSGDGAATAGAIMATGKIDVLGFIGGTGGADALIRAHPAPHRLKVVAQLAGKNVGVVLPDADLEVAAAQCALGATSYNGQRCTALKLMLVHDSVADAFVQKLVRRVGELKGGLPWEEGVSLTPLPEPTKPKYLEGLIADALARNATLANAAGGGGELRGALMTPAVLDHVRPEMRVFTEEQFGPVVPVARFSHVSEVHAALKEAWAGQQASLFTSSAEAAAPLVDALATIVGRININAQCGRSPDAVPFSGRRSSALGTMSVADSIRAFSVETVIAYPAAQPASERVAKGLDATTAFLAPV